MADLAASDVTITAAREDSVIAGKKRRNLVKIQFGNGALTIPSGGVPLPDYPAFGMVRNLDALILHDSDDAQGIVWKWDKENNKLRAYVQGVTVSAAGSATMDDFPINTTGDLATPQSFSLSNAGTAGTYYLGRLKEVAALAPAAQTIYAEAVGW